LGKAREDAVMAIDASTNRNHHLWNNHGTWWAHATVLHGGIRQERVRRSMGTRDPIEARRRRDRFLAELDGRTDLKLSIRIGDPRTATVDADDCEPDTEARAAVMEGTLPSG
jgi:hypothetical protein